MCNRDIGSNSLESISPLSDGYFHHLMKMWELRFRMSGVEMELQAKPPNLSLTVTTWFSGFRHPNKFLTLYLARLVGIHRHCTTPRSQGRCGGKGRGAGKTAQSLGSASRHAIRSTATDERKDSGKYLRGAAPRHRPPVTPDCSSTPRFPHSRAGHFHSLCLPRKSNSGCYGLGARERAGLKRPAPHSEVTSLHPPRAFFPRPRTGRSHAVPSSGRTVRTFPWPRSLPSPPRGPNTPHLTPVRGSPVRLHSPGNTQGRLSLREGFRRESAAKKCFEGNRWDAGALGKLQGGREGFPPSWSRPRMESTGKGPPGPQSLPWSLSPPPPRPRLFTYEVAHGGRIGIPVALPKRHSSPTEPGPGNPPPPLSGSRLHPLGVPGSSSSPELFPGSAEAARPARPLRGARHPARGAGAGPRGGRAPATCAAGAPRRRRHQLQAARAGCGRRVEPAGGRAGPCQGTQVALSPPEEPAAQGPQPGE